VTRGRWEQKRMAYLAIPGPQELDLGRSAPQQRSAPP
jgi:hypothetical protein